MEPDGIVLGADNPQALNSYSYVLNDPTGHMATPVGEGGGDYNPRATLAAGGIRVRMPSSFTKKPNGGVRCDGFAVALLSISQLTLESEDGTMTISSSIPITRQGFEGLDEARHRSNCPGSTEPAWAGQVQ
jgi:hypothetical protein